MEIIQERAALLRHLTQTDPDTTLLDQIDACFGSATQPTIRLVQNLCESA